MVSDRHENKIVIPNPQFDTEEVRYEHIFGSFANLLTLPLMPYTQFNVGIVFLILGGWTGTQGLGLISCIIFVRKF